MRDQDQDLGRPARRGEDAEGGRRHADRRRRRRQVAAAFLLDASGGARSAARPAFDAALRGENGGFAGETFEKSGELFKQLVDLQPFQNGFLGFKNPQAVGYFGDGKAAMTLAISIRLPCCSARSPPTRSGSATTRSAGSIFPSCPAARATPTDTLGGITGWLITKGSPKEATDFLKFFISQGRADAAGRRQLPRSRGQGRRGRHQPAPS